MRCIHQKQTPQQPMSSRLTKLVKVGLIAFESCLAVRLAGIISAVLYESAERRECR
jgi:hypothetical protein